MTGLFSTIQCPSKARSRLDGSILPVPYHFWAIGAGEPEYTTCYVNLCGFLYYICDEDFCKVIHNGYDSVLFNVIFHS